MVRETYCRALLSVVDEALGLNIESNSSDDDVMMNCSYMHKDVLLNNIFGAVLE